ncbi:hypothetical protein BJX76DRAFT_336187 [Aspergillus varians]
MKNKKLFKPNPLSETPRIPSWLLPALQKTRASQRKFWKWLKRSRFTKSAKGKPSERAKLVKSPRGPAISNFMPLPDRPVLVVSQPGMEPAIDEHVTDPNTPSTPSSGRSSSRVGLEPSRVNIQVPMFTPISPVDGATGIPTPNPRSHSIKVRDDISQEDTKPSPESDTSNNARPPASPPTQVAHIQWGSTPSPDHYCLTPDGRRVPFRSARGYDPLRSNPINEASNGVTGTGSAQDSCATTYMGSSTHRSQGPSLSSSSSSSRRSSNDTTAAIVSLLGRNRDSGGGSSTSTESSKHTNPSRSSQYSTKQSLGIESGDSADVMMNLPYWKTGFPPALGQVLSAGDVARQRRSRSSPAPQSSRWD